MLFIVEHTHTPTHTHAYIHVLGIKWYNRISNTKVLLQALMPRISYNLCDNHPKKSCSFPQRNQVSVTWGGHGYLWFYWASGVWRWTDCHLPGRFCYQWNHRSEPGLLLSSLWWFCCQSWCLCWWVSVLGEAFVCSVQNMKHSFIHSFPICAFFLPWSAKCCQSYVL